MHRRHFVRAVGALPLVPLVSAHCEANALGTDGAVRHRVHRSRPSDPSWPSASQWEMLNRQVGGQLSQVQSPLSACQAPDGAAGCAAAFEKLKNPYYIRDQAGLTQTLGWADAWTSVPSAYVVTVKETEHVVAA